MIFYVSFFFYASICLAHRIQGIHNTSYHKYKCRIGAIICQLKLHLYNEVCYDECRVYLSNCFQKME